MKIGIITPYKDYPGGVETVNNILFNVFTEDNHEVDFLTADKFDHNLFTKLMVKIIGLPFITYWKYRKSVSQYDIVIANGEFSWGISHPKLINVFHGSYKGYRDYLKKIWSRKTFLHLTRRAYIQKIGAKGNYVVTVSQFVKNVLEEDGVQVNDTIVNCIDTNIFFPKTINTDRRNYLFIGSYNYYAKGFDILQAISDHGFKVHCVTDKEPPAGLIWVKNLDNSKMGEEINKYRVLIFPSRFEGLGLVALEAMGCGLPIIMGNVGLGVELEKVIPEFVVKSCDARDYIERIQEIEKNYDKFSGRARNYVVNNHSFDLFKERWLELIKKI